MGNDQNFIIITIIQNLLGIRYYGILIIFRDGEIFSIHIQIKGNRITVPNIPFTVPNGIYVIYTRPCITHKETNRAVIQNNRLAFTGPSAIRNPDHKLRHIFHSLPGLTAVFRINKGRRLRTFRTIPGITTENDCAVRKRCAAAGTNAVKLLAGIFHIQQFHRRPGSAAVRRSAEHQKRRFNRLELAIAVEQRFICFAAVIVKIKIMVYRIAGNRSAVALIDLRTGRRIIRFKRTQIIVITALAGPLQKQAALTVKRFITYRAVICAGTVKRNACREKC